jgi:hypothetical protein
MSYNPKVKDFLKLYDDVTLIGLFWAGYWRLSLIVMGVYIALWMVGVIVAVMIGVMI